MNQVVYLRYELLRSFRNRRFLLFSLVFPLVLFLSVAGSNRDAMLLGIPFPLYYMTGMAAWGTMMAVISGGSRIATERAAGWTRQMRITPLTTRSYFRAKVLTSYLLALTSLLILCLAGSALGVRLTAPQWLEMAGLILIGLVPFAILGVLFGHLLTVDSLGPAVGGLTSLFALLGGAFGPIGTGGFLVTLEKCIPSYWLVQAGRTAVGGGSWPPEAWVVVLVWSAALAYLAVVVYRRDTGRV